MGRSVLAPLVLVLTACSVGALEGFAGERPADQGADAGAGDGGAAAADGAAPSTDASTQQRCTPGSSADSICTSFDDGAPESGWSVVPGSGTYSVVTQAHSPPNAVLFTLVNAGTSTSGTRFDKQFAGPWSSIDCTFAFAIDEAPSNGGVDIAGASTQAPSDDNVGLRIYGDRFVLLSCRDDSNCQPEVHGGPLTPLGEFHVARLEWLDTGEYRFSLDGNLRATIATATPLSSPRDGRVSFGVLFRPFGSGGTWRVRHDDISCVRRP